MGEREGNLNSKMSLWFVFLKVKSDFTISLRNRVCDNNKKKSESTTV